MLRHKPNGRRCETVCEAAGTLGDGPKGAAVAAVRSGRASISQEIAEACQWSLRSVDSSRGWQGSPLRQPIIELADHLQQIADAGFVVGVTDECGALVWTCGDPAMRRHAELVNFAAGTRWSESTTASNVIALAPDSRRPSTVSSAEHAVETLCDWVHYKAPIRNPQGKSLGVLYFSTPSNRANPLAMSMVRAMAALVETRLHNVRLISDAQDAAPDSAADVTLRCLGRTEVTVDGTPVQVSPRQAEILTLLTLRPDGYTPAEFGLELYGDRPISMSTLKSEVSRLRRMIGGGIATHRYLLTTRVRCDATEVLGHVKAGDIVAAAESYGGLLLPESEAPGVVSWRNRLEVAIREAALRSGDPQPAVILGERIDHDPELHEHALSLLAPDDARVPLVAGRLHVLSRDCG